MQPQTADVPTWMGILMFIVGLAMTVAMAKWVVGASEKKGSKKLTVKADVQHLGETPQEEILARSN